MILVDRSSEPRNCPLCKNKYDAASYRPEALIPCGHTFCSKCVANFEQACKMCASRYNQVIPDHEMIDLVQLVNKKLHVNRDSDFTSDKKEFPEEANRLKPEIYHLIMSGTRAQQLMGTELVRKMLSVTDKPPIQDVIKADGLLSKFVEFLDCHENERLQFEAAWVMINVASGSSEQTKAVIDAGALPRLIKLINSTNEDLQEQAVWAIGNIAGDSSKLRDLVINSEVFEPLFKILLENKVSQKLINNSIWCLSNLCRGKPQVSMESLRKMLPVLSHLLKTQTNTEALIDTCWAISYLSDGANERIQAVIDSIDLRRLLELLEKDQMTNPVLRVFGNIATGDDEQTAVVVQLGVIEHLQKLIEHPKESIKVEVCWFLSNITAGTRTQIQAVIDSGVILKAIALYPNGSLKMKNEIAWILGNVTSSGSREQTSYIVENGGVELLLEHLEINERTKARVAYDSLENLVNLIDPEINDIITKKCTMLNLTEIVESAKEEFS